MRTCCRLFMLLLAGCTLSHATATERANDGGTPLRAEEPTIAWMLKQKGHATGGFGKWGADGRDSTGVPEKHGFDVFFGYYDQVHAHSFYPPYLIRNNDTSSNCNNTLGRGTFVSCKTSSNAPSSPPAQDRFSFMFRTKTRLPPISSPQ